MFMKLKWAVKDDRGYDRATFTKSGNVYIHEVEFDQQAWDEFKVMVDEMFEMISEEL